jgi:hypothetical protein
MGSPGKKGDRIVHREESARMVLSFAGLRARRLDSPRQAVLY